MSQSVSNDYSSNNNDSLSGMMQVVSIPDIWLHHFLPYLTFQDVARCEQVFRCFNKDKTWQFLCQRDFELHSKEAPDASFQTIRHDCETWKQVYQRWRAWHSHTHHVTTTKQGFDAIRLYQDIRSYYTQQQQKQIVPRSYKDSFSPALDAATLQSWAKHPLVPSDLVAWYAVCGGQIVLSPNYRDEDFWAAFLGCYSCYNACYAMRLIDANIMGPMGVNSQTNYPNNHVLVALCIGNPRLCVSVRKDPIHDPHGRRVRLHPFGHDDRNSIVVGNQGILQYFQEHVKHLTSGTFPMASTSPETPHARGIVLFPDAGDAVSVCVTHGIEVRASARWLPTFSDSDRQPWQEEEEGLNFGYSVRIRMVNSSIGNTCQLVSRHWEFVNGHGMVRRVDGEAVVGKQPLFFFQAFHGVQTHGYQDLGPAGDDKSYSNSVFTYQSQTGAVAGTTRQDTHGAHVRGFFRFVPGSIEQPKGPSFNVTVAPFPLTVPFPFY